MIINPFQLLNFISSIFLSIINSFNVFSYSKVTTLIHSPNFVYFIFNLLIYSFVIKIAIDVRRTVELVSTIPILGLIIEIVELVMIDPDLNNFLVIINKTFFLFKIFFISSYNIQ